MNLRRIKRKSRQHKGKILIGVIAVLILILAVFFITSHPRKQLYELTEVDVLSIKDLEGDQVMLKGITFGDTQQEVLNVIGYPDTQAVYSPDITNMEFGKAFGLNETGVILQFKVDSLEKITLLPSFNDLLQGKTKINYTSDRFLIMYGVSDSVKQIPVAKGSPIVMRMYRYTSGVEFASRRGVLIALSFVRPNTVVESAKTFTES